MNKIVKYLSFLSICLLLLSSCIDWSTTRGGDTIYMENTTGNNFSEKNAHNLRKQMLRRQFVSFESRSAAFCFSEPSTQSGN